MKFSLPTPVHFLADPPPPPNDAFTNSIPLTGFFAMVASSIGGATWELDEPDSSINTNGGSAWWTWTAPAPGMVILTGQGYDSALAVFSGSSIGNLDRIATSPKGNDAAHQLRFFAQSGRTYQIAAEKLGANADSVVFSLLLEAQQFTASERLSSGGFRFQFPATPGPNWAVETSVDLDHWTPIYTNANVSGLFDFFDDAALNFPQRFYRARQE